MTAAKGKGARSKKRKKSPAVGHRFKLALAGLFLAGFLIASLVIISALKQSYRQDVVAPPATADLTQLSQDIQVELESAVLRSGASLERLKVSRDGDTHHFDIDGRFPNEKILAELSQRLHRLDPGLEFLVSAQENRLVLQKGKASLYVLEFSPNRQIPVPAARPRIAIIMDDLGRDIHLANQALDIGQPITMAILPNERYAAEIATLAHRRGREVMVHIPMEPEGYPAANPGENALFTNLTTAEIQRRFATYLDRVPYAAGGNNHMGSHFTKDREAMRAVLEVMRQEGLFFVDSRTTGGSVALEEALRMKIPATARDVFLDNDADIDRIARQIRKLVVLAGKKGSALGICHPHPETLAALQQELPGLLGDGVDLVPASQLLRR